jgi:hypothetical protein
MHDRFVSTPSDQEIDSLILSTAHAQWRKVAFIVSSVLLVCRKNAAAPDEYDIADRIQALVGEGKLEAQGNLNRWRHSEVRLPNSAGQEP